MRYWMVTFVGDYFGQKVLVSGFTKEEVRIKILLKSRGCGRNLQIGLIKKVDINEISAPKFSVR